MFNRKFRSRTLSLLGLLFLLIIISSCKSDEDNSNPLTSRESDFVGTWVLTKVTITELSGPHVYTPAQVNLSMTIQINSDKSFSGSTTIMGQTETRSGNWNINGDFVVLTSGSDTEFFPYTVEGNKFTIEQNIPDGDIVYLQVLEFTKQ